MGPLEILIVLVIALVVFGGYFRKRLPEFGRVAGRNARIGGEKAKELADQAGVKGGEVSSKVGEKVGDRFDPADMGRSAGKHVREAREFRDSFKAMNPMAETKAKPETKPAEQEPAAVTAEPGPKRETTVAAQAAKPEPEPELEPKTGSEDTEESAERPKPEGVPPNS